MQALAIDNRLTARYQSNPVHQSHRFRECFVACFGWAVINYSFDLFSCGSSKSTCARVKMVFASGGNAAVGRRAGGHNVKRLNQSSTKQADNNLVRAECHYGFAPTVRVLVR
jgi:hypothetical protein